MLRVPGTFKLLRNKRKKKMKTKKSEETKLKERIDIILGSSSLCLNMVLAELPGEYKAN